MNIVCSHDELKRTLQTVGRGLSPRSTVQILAGVHMRAESAEHPVVLSATDMELSVRATLDAQVRAPGEIVLPGRLVTDLIGKSSNDEVTIEQRDGDTQVQVKTGHAEASLSTYTVQDFPRLPEFDEERAFGIEREGFLRTLEAVQRAASRDESRPVLTGVKLELAPGRLTMAATDSYRMAVKHTTLAGGPPEEIEAIVPARALAELARIAGDSSDDTIDMAVDANQVLFRSGGATLSARRIDGQFPNYRQLLPDAFEHIVPVRREDLRDVIARAELLAGRNSPIRLSFAPGELTVSARTQDVGEFRESLPCDFRGDPLDIGFNPGFLRDGLECLKGEEQVNLKLITPLRPGLVTGEGDDFWYLVMPIRLSS